MLTTISLIPIVWQSLASFVNPNHLEKWHVTNPLNLVTNLAYYTKKFIQFNARQSRCYANIVRLSWRILDIETTEQCSEKVNLIVA